MTEILWSAAEAVKATNGRLIGHDDWKATGFAMDSREVKSGDIFIAMTGGEGGLDGHDYIPSAIQNGAVAVIVSKDMNVDVPQIIVKNTFEALQDLGQFARARGALQQSIAITGSVGKTGVRNMVDKAFAGNGYRTHASIKSYNNHVGVPFTLANMMASSDIGVFEIGMNHANEITPLSKQVKPDIAIITWIADVHVENFDDGIQ